jgi:hypothetical protein
MAEVSPHRTSVRSSFASQQSFGDRQFRLTMFRDQTGTFASQCFGERQFRLTVFRRETLLPHSVSATGTFVSQSFGDRQFLPYRVFGDRHFRLTVFFGERHFCLTEFRRQAVSPHSVLATAVTLQSFSATGIFRLTTVIRRETVSPQCFGERQFRLTVFQWQAFSPHRVLATGTFAKVSATGTFASQCFGERRFCLTVFRREALSPHSVSARGSFASQCFGDKVLSPHSVSPTGILMVK